MSQSIEIGLSILNENVSQFGTNPTQEDVEQEITMTEACAKGKNVYLHPSEAHFFIKLPKNVRETIYTQFREQMK